MSRVQCRVSKALRFDSMSCSLRGIFPISSKSPPARLDLPMAQMGNGQIVLDFEEFGVPSIQVGKYPQCRVNVALDQGGDTSSKNIFQSSE